MLHKNHSDSGEYCAIILTADRHVETCLHTCLYSLLKSSSIHLRIYLYHDGFSGEKLSKINSLVQSHSCGGELIPIQKSEQQFCEYRSLKGSRYVYTRFAAFQDVDENKAVYIDVDTIVNVDIRALFKIDLAHHVLAVAGIRRVASTPDRTFFLSNGFEDTDVTFNSGVLLVNLDEWRKQDFSERCYQLALSSQKFIKTADQAVLNVIAKNAYLILDKKFNVLLHPWYPRLPLYPKHAIYHFAGHPKPWDLLGKYLHNNYGLFEAVLRKTAYKYPGDKFTARNLYKYLYSAKSYYKCLKMKCRKN